jgi:hypothetical protein
MAGVLSKGGCREADRRGGREEEGAVHFAALVAGPSSIGRTLTTFIMPACMW